MKINTDGVLLGALARFTQPIAILDIGTGTGVIALMLAQRFSQALVDAVEIDIQAAATAEQNFKSSPFSDRLNLYATSFEAFKPLKNYDLIVSNPPFFVNDLKNSDYWKGVARHTDVGFFDVLMGNSADFLNEAGKLYVVVPVDRANYLIQNKPASLTLTQCINFRSFKNKIVFRQLLCFTKGSGALEEEDFVLYDSLGVHSESYNKLLKDFFIHL